MDVCHPAHPYQLLSDDSISSHICQLINTPTGQNCAPPQIDLQMVYTAEGGLDWGFFFLYTVMLFKPLISTKDSWEKTLQIQLQCRAVSVSSCAEILSDHWTKTSQHVSFLDAQYIVANKYKVNDLYNYDPQNVHIMRNNSTYNQINLKQK